MIFLLLWGYDKIPSSWDTTLIGSLAGVEIILDILFVVWNISKIMETIR